MDKDCFNLRRHLRCLGRKLLNDPDNISLRQTFIKVRNDYNKLRKKKRKECIKILTTQHEDTHDTNPKLFWKTLNNIKNSNNNKNNNSKSISEWTEYFETLYKANQNETNFDEEVNSFLADPNIKKRP